MPKVDLSKIPVKTGSSYPGHRAALVGDRSQQAVGKAGGITQFGANLVRLPPGALSSLRHWHEQQDEMLIVTEGEATLIDDHGETLMRPGDIAAFPAGDTNGHHLVNKSDADVVFFVVGTHTDTEVGYYSDEDMMVRIDASGYHFTKKDGSALD